ncbi:MAG: DUF4124 domain-containing protein, partial [Gammaproteobacteria bacterium]|nr:DUF4124 domain-containing protein [Gammaproteobacteria bacterium]
GSTSAPRVELRSTRPSDGAGSTLLYSVDGPLASDDPSTTTLYRWRDERGVLHYESIPPPDSVSAQALSIKRAAGPGSDGMARERATGTPSERPPTGPDRSDDAVLRSPWSVYTPDGSQDLMQRIDRTLDMLEERDSLLDRLRGMDRGRARPSHLPQDGSVSQGGNAGR